MFYVYKITNKINGKFYIGKRKSRNPPEDSYMGSGKLILAAIKKYGAENFQKEILEIFDTNDQAAEFEKKLVTRELIESGKSYNLHEGGHGGFLHINQLPPEERPNIKSFKQKVANGDIKVGGTIHWTEKSYARVREQKWGARNWESLTPEEYQTRIDKISRAVSGHKNGAYGTHIYIDPNLKEIPDNKTLHKHRFKDGEQPPGWIKILEWREKNKNKTCSSYGRRWYNNGERNFFIYPTDERIATMNLQSGKFQKTLDTRNNKE